MFSVLLTTFFACNGSDKAEQEDTSSASTSIDVSGSTCTSTFTFNFPNSGTVDIDFCARHELEAQFEFDPDDPPEIRQPVMTFYSTLDEGFECTLTISEPSACGVGYYLMDGSSGVTTTTTLDCENVPDEYEGNFSSNGGYLQVTNVDTGTQAGNFTGTPLRTTIEGYLNVTTIEGIGITGFFSLSEDITGIDSEEVECITNDGDIDNDGDIATVFGGTDCNDNDPNIEGLDSDNDGVSLCDGDCNDDDSALNPFDADGDGVSTCDEDCDDSNAYRVSCGSVNFNGFSSRVEVPNGSLFVNDTLTIEAWVYPEAVSTNSSLANIVSTDEWSGGGARGFVLGLGSGYPFLKIGTPNGWNYVYSDSAVSLYEWHHFAGIYDNQNLSIYVDGVLQGTEQVSVLSTPNLGLCFGDNIGTGGPNVARYYQGGIDMVRISDVVRYTNNFSPDYTWSPDQNTLGLWHMDMGMGNTIYDMSGNNYHGTATDISWSQSTVQ